MSVTEELLQNNAAYAESFEKGDLPLPPARGVAVVACMDARLDVHKILGLEEGDAHVIRNAGGIITDDEVHSLTKVRSNELDQEVELESSLLKPVIRSGSIGRYWARRTALVLFPYKQDNGFRLIPEAEMKSRFPKAWSYL